MRSLRSWGLVAILLLGAWATPAPAQGWRKNDNEIDAVNKRLNGRVVDHTANHGVDRRIFARSLWQRRDLYVYVPPGYDCVKRYPFMIFLHSWGEDEHTFLREIVPQLDDAISTGRLPPLIVAAPDGSFRGEPEHNCHTGTFFLNSRLGDYEDFVLTDVWDFVCSHYPIRRERQAHILMGVGMGGFAAYNYGIRFREAFGVVIGLAPPLNMRWANKKGNYLAKFDPCDWGWRKNINKFHEPASYGPVDFMKVSMRTMLEPLYGANDNALLQMAVENPIELAQRCRLRDGELEMYVAYGARDDLNIDAQVESFLYWAKFACVTITVNYDPSGRHSWHCFRGYLPSTFSWLAPRIAAYSVPPTPAVARSGVGPELVDRWSGGNEAQWLGKLLLADWGRKKAPPPAPEPPPPAPLAEAPPAEAALKTSTRKWWHWPLGSFKKRPPATEPAAAPPSDTALPAQPVATETKTPTSEVMLPPPSTPNAPAPDAPEAPPSIPSIGPNVPEVPPAPTAETPLRPLLTPPTPTPPGN